MGDRKIAVFIESDRFGDAGKKEGIDRDVIFVPDPHPGTNKPGVIVSRRSRMLMTGSQADQEAEYGQIWSKT
jgi:hypothetical protein